MENPKDKPGTRSDPASRTVQQLIAEAHDLRSQAAGTFLRSARMWLWAAIKRAIQRRQSRRLLHELLFYDDRLLRDMGLNRHDVLMALRNPENGIAIPDRRKAPPDENGKP